MGANLQPGGVSAAQAYAQSYLGAAMAFSGDAAAVLNGVRIPHLYPGSKLQMRLANTSSGSEAFRSSMLRKIAASTGTSYEEFTGDLSRPSFAAVRAAMHKTWVARQSMKRGIANRVAGGIYRGWLEEAILTGQITSMPRGTATPAWLYAQQRLDALGAAEWIGGSRPSMDELKEAQAAVLRMSRGLSTQEDECAPVGKDWRRVNRQAAREMRQRESLRLQDPVETRSEAAIAKGPKDPAAGNASTGLPEVAMTPDAILSVEVDQEVEARAWDERVSDDAAA